MVCFLINVPLMYHLAQPRCLEAWRGPGAGMRTRLWGRNADPILDRFAITNRAAQNRVRNPAHARRRIGFGSGPECGTDSEPISEHDSGPNCRHDSGVIRTRFWRAGGVVVDRCGSLDPGSDPVAPPGAGSDPGSPPGLRQVVH